MLSVFIGYDRREAIAWDVCAYTLAKHASQPVFVQPLKIEKLKAQGLITRQTIGKHDINSDAPVSTEFANSRFLTPLLAQSGWVIFIDCDMIFLGDVYEILNHLDDSKAVMCVRHSHRPAESVKMDGCHQSAYERKNWSSFMAFNCDHPANLRLSVDSVNRMPGRDLHAFYWLNDAEIGFLPAGWNWLVNVQDKPDDAIVAHYTLGGPWFDNWQKQPHDELWLNALQDMIDGRKQ